MPITTTPSERIGRCTRMRRSFVRFNRPESFVHTRSSAGFTIITSGFEFSVHTGVLRCDQSRTAVLRDQIAAGANTGNTSMIRALRFWLLIGAGLAASAGASAQMLEPPDNHYFTSQGSWGQKYPDQWALQRIGFDATPNSAWRLVKKNAQPVIVAVIDTGLDWNHRNIDPENIWRNPKETAGNGVDDDKNGYIDDVIGWDFFDRDGKPWDFDGHGTFVSGIIAGSWKDKDGIAGINPFAR